ncbi:MAG: hypothetical protein NXH72_03245 [Hyphomonadaceae bacterium]|nr:hypothetical protein [Hyphomonadaceae bacterium]
MPAALFLPLLLRLAGPLAFIGAAIIAGILNRSIMLVPLLALAGTGTTVLIRFLAPSPAMDIKAMLDPNSQLQKPSPFKGIGQRFGLGVLGFGLVFGVSALIAALFQATEFEPRVNLSDAGFLVVPGLIAVIGAWLSARLGLNQMAGMMQDMQGMFSQMQAGPEATSNDEDAFTVEGEIIDRDDQPS